MPLLEHGRVFDWYSMPVARRTLRDAAPTLSDEDLGRVLIHAARGLAASHARDRVHRDVKPSNILELEVDEDNTNWVIADFGLVARTAEPTTHLRTAAALGTRGFIAPEIALGLHKAATAAADVFSLGRTIVWATTGVEPTGFDSLPARGHWARLANEMTLFEIPRRIQTMDRVIDEVEQVLGHVRTDRAKSWRAPMQSLTHHEELVLATFLGEAEDTEDDTNELAASEVAFRDLDMPRAIRRVAMRKLHSRGFIRYARTNRGDFQTELVYVLTEDGWKWADENAERLERLVPKRPSVSQRPPEPDFKSQRDDDLPF